MCLRAAAVNRLEWLRLEYLTFTITTVGIKNVWQLKLTGS